MLPKSLDQITAEDINRLVSEKTEERRTLDFKAKLPGKSEDDKRELCADATSFANTSGGDIIYGITDKEGQADELVGVGDADLDQEKLRLEQTIQSGIEPRLPTIQTEVVGIENGKRALILRIGKSWRGPHWVKVKADTYRMYSRRGNGKNPMDTSEIRAAISGTNHLETRIKSWIRERPIEIASKDTVYMLDHSSFIVLQMIPMESLSGYKEIDLSRAASMLGSFRPLASGGWDTRYNIDGIAMLAPSRERTGLYKSYSQIFRSGIIESSSTGLVEYSGERSSLLIGAQRFEKEIINAVHNYMAGLRAIGVAPPVVLAVSLHNVRGAILLTGYEYSDEHGRIDRDNVYLPEVVIDDLDVSAELISKGVLDGLWNAAGFEKCCRYNEHGRWAPSSW